MSSPNIRYYARMEDVTGGKKTPKYKVTKTAGYYPPMDALKGKGGAISFYLMASKDSGSTKDNAPAMKLQGKNSLNFTGLKEYFKDGKISGFAYGYPLDKETYSKDNKPNPFYEYKTDCFLFVIHSGEASMGSQQPKAIELIVLEGARVMGAAYLKQLVMGGFDEDLQQVRSIAK